MIRRVSIRNFKSLREVRIDLEPFTVFVGPNASGKSSILHALDLLCRAFLGKGVDIGGELVPCASWGTSEPIDLIGNVGDAWYRYRSKQASTPRPTPIPGVSDWVGTGCGFASEPDPEAWRAWKVGASQDDPMPGSILLRLESSKLLMANANAPDPTIMAPNGIGLHSALAGMALHDPDTWAELQANLKRIIPTIQRLRHTKLGDSPPTVLFDTIRAKGLLPNQVSEGTLLVLGLLAALHAPNRPNLVLLDDIDRGLHPRAQKELIALLRGLLAANPDLQILATTHSPYLLDCMEVGEVRMTYLKEDGETACAPLANHPDSPRWKDEMTPGEMWSLFGEKWVAGQEVGA